MSKVLVIAQAAEGVATELSLQCLAAARAAADRIGGTVTALVGGKDVGSAAPTLIQHGADEVRVADADALSPYLTTPFRKAVRAATEGESWALVLLPASTMGDDLAPFVAHDLGAACVLDAVGIDADASGCLLARRLEYDRKVTSTFTAAEGKALVVTLKDGAADALPADAARNGQVVTVDLPGDLAGAAEVVRRDVVAKSVNLKAARIIVAAGAGVGTRENFARIEELAARLGAQIGATRAVVDAGWLPADHQIGQTGAVVRPDVYIGCGISGAVQHWVGMSEAKTIVAINTDASAPLMRRAHYRIVGDVNDVVPKLTQLAG